MGAGVSFLCATPAHALHAPGTLPEETMLSLAARLAALPLALAVALAAPPQLEPRAELTLSGRITDAGSKAGIEGAQVLIAGTGFGAVSNAQGHFVAKLPDELRQTTVQVQVRRIGYATTSRFVVLLADRITVDFALQQAAVSVATTIIVADESRKLQTITGSVSQIATSLNVQSGYSPAPLMSRERIARAERRAIAGDSAAASWNTEGYDVIVDNPFLATDVAPRSTFSIDVDRASYSNIRRFLTTGSLPPKDAVRIEEMLNYFTYDYPQPEGVEPFSVTTDVVAAPWNAHHRLVRVGLQGREARADTLPPSNLVFLIDVSGSMQSMDKLPLLKSAFRVLVNQLREEDRVAIVVYAGAAGLVLPSTSGADKTRILDAIDQLEAGGSTAGGAGLRLAYDVARTYHNDEGTNRVILATDGDFNVGVSSNAEMVRLIEERRAQGTHLTVLGFGTGNLKDSKLEKLADHGNGNYAYIDNIAEARKVLVREIGGTLVTIAKDVKLQIEFNPARVAGYRLIGYENRMLRDEDFNDDTKDAGELGAGHSVTALYEIVPVGAPDADSLRRPDSLRYQRPVTRTTASSGSELIHVQLRYKPPTGDVSRLTQHVVQDQVGVRSPDLAFASAVAAFGMVLRDSPHRGTATLEQVLVLAEEGSRNDPHGDRAEFIDLVRKARQLGAEVVAVQQR
jgi:Ca-activated chloride channel family protein